MQYMADYETVNKKYDCRVWVWGCCEIETPDNFTWGKDLDSFMCRCANIYGNDIYYFHNARFDCDFIMNWCFKNGYIHVKDRNELETKTFTTLISDKGQFYSMQICFYTDGKYKNIVTFYDSGKIIPLSVKKMAKAYGLKIGKGEIKYNAYRPIGYNPTDREIDYLKRDCKIPAIILKDYFSQGLVQMTQGSNALHMFKYDKYGKKEFERDFPKLDYDAEIRDGYKGGIVLVKKGEEHKIHGKGIILDVNSLYPWVMYTQLMPYGKGVYFDGEFIPDSLFKLAIFKVKVNFKVKPNHLPCIQIKKHYSQFADNEYLESSNDEDVIICVTNVEWKLIQKQYDIDYVEYLGGYKYQAKNDIFKEYIDHWTTIKVQAGKDKNDGLRMIAKLMLNSLYGKFGTRTDVRSKIPYYKEGEGIRFTYGKYEDRDPVYLPIACFVTAYARTKLITSAQLNYDRFMYGDTDSMHLKGWSIPDNIEIDDFKLGAWAIEGRFRKARYLRQKCYIESVAIEKEPFCEKKPKYKDSVTIAGMPDTCHSQVTFDNFKLGMSYENGRLRQQRVDGGIILTDAPFTIR